MVTIQDALCPCKVKQKFTNRPVHTVAFFLSNIPQLLCPVEMLSTLSVDLRGTRTVLLVMFLQLLLEFKIGIFNFHGIL